MRIERVLMWTLLAAVGAAQINAQEERRLLAFGDSITIGFREPGVDCNRPVDTARGYPEHLEELLQADGYDVRISPFGICGENTFQGLSRLDDVLASEAGEVVLIMEGTNDIAGGGSNTISNETILKNLQLMAEKISDDGRIPMMSSVIPYGPNLDRQFSLNDRARRLADDIRQWTSQERIPFSDPYNFLISLPNVYSNYYHPDGYHLNASGNEVLASAFRSDAGEALDRICEPAACVPGPETLCLASERFQVEVEWQVGDQLGTGQVTPLPGGDTGTVWFFNPDNIELVVKVLDGRCVNGAFWVFYGALSDVAYTITVTDSVTCERAFYTNPIGTVASAGDTQAFAEACPSDDGG